MNDVAVNRQWRLINRPLAEPGQADFELREVSLAQPARGQVRVRTQWLSVDPYMRGRMRAGPSYAPAVELGEVMVGEGVGEVVASQAPGLEVGAIVAGRFGWQTEPLVEAAVLRRVDPGLAPVQTALGVLGMPGLTAYFGLLEVGQPVAGETVVVSAAAGAVGAVVGQIARIKGCRVVGIVGSAAKCRYLQDELGFDAAVDYHSDNLGLALAKVCPDGIDVYFDNVGGRILDTVLDYINLHARIAICGMISEYNLPAPECVPRPTRHLLVHRARMQGLLVSDWSERFPEGVGQLAVWLRAGRLKYREDVVRGFENMPQALLRLFHGENFGKQLVRVA